MFEQKKQFEDQKYFKTTLQIVSALCFIGTGLLGFQTLAFGRGFLNTIGLHKIQQRLRRSVFGWWIGCLRRIRKVGIAFPNVNMRINNSHDSPPCRLPRLASRSDRQY